MVSEVYENGFRLKDSYYIGNARILTDNYKMMEKVPPIVMDAIEMRTNYIVTYVPEREVIILKITHDKFKRKHVQILDKLVPLIKPPEVPLYYGQLGEWEVVYDEDMDSVTLFHDTDSITFKPGVPDELILDAMNTVLSKSSDKIKYSITIDSEEELAPKKKKLETVSYPPAPRPKTIIPPSKPPKYVFEPVPGVDVVYDGKMLHNVKIDPATVKNVYKWTGWEYPEIIEVKPGSITIVKRDYPNTPGHVTRKGNVLLFDVKGWKSMASIDGRFVYCCPDATLWNNAEKKFNELIDKYFGKEKNNVKWAKFNGYKITFEYESNRKHYITTVFTSTEDVLDRTCGAFHGPILALNGWREVSGKCLRDVIGAEKIPKTRKKFPTGPIPLNKAKKVVGMDTNVIEYHFENGLRLKITANGSYFLMNKDRVIKDGTIRDDDYDFVLMLIESDAGEVSMLL